MEVVDATAAATSADEEASGKEFQQRWEKIAFSGQQGSATGDGGRSFLRDLP